MGYFQDTLPKAGSIADREFMDWNQMLLASGQRLSVKVGDGEMKRVTAFDVKKGWAEGYAEDEDGKIISHHGVIGKLRLVGKVKVDVVKK